eukprot:sb/3471324/
MPWLGARQISHAVSELEADVVVSSLISKIPLASQILQQPSATARADCDVSCDDVVDVTEGVETKQEVQTVEKQEDRQTVEEKQTDTKQEDRQTDTKQEDKQTERQEVDGLRDHIAQLNNEVASDFLAGIVSHQEDITGFLTPELAELTDIHEGKTDGQGDEIGRDGNAETISISSFGSELSFKDTI